MRRGRLGWVLNPVPHESEYVTLICRLNKENNGFHSFLLFGRIDRAKPSKIREDDPWWENGRRLELRELYEATQEISTTGTRLDLGPSAAVPKDLFVSKV